MKRYEVGYIIKSWVYVDANSQEEAEEAVKRQCRNAEIIEVNELDETALAVLLNKIRQNNHR